MSSFLVPGVVADRVDHSCLNPMCGRDVDWSMNFCAHCGHLVNLQAARYGALSLIGAFCHKREGSLTSDLAEHYRQFIIAALATGVTMAQVLRLATRLESTFKAEVKEAFQLLEELDTIINKAKGYEV